MDTSNAVGPAGPKHLPYIKFFPDNWMHDAGLRQCSPATRGVWMDLLCLMHQGEPYGYLAGPTGPFSVKFLADWCSVSTRELLKILAELGKFHVTSQTDSGVVFCRRMVRDEKVRRARSSGGIKSIEHPNTPKPKANKGTHEGYPSVEQKTQNPDHPSGATHGNGYGSSSSEVNASDTENPSTREFDFDIAVLELWNAYPAKGRVSLGIVERLYPEILLCAPDGATLHAQILDAITGKWSRSAKWAKGFVLALPKWLDGKCWMEDPEPVTQTKCAWEIGLEDENDAA